MGLEMIYLIGIVPSFIIMAALNEILSHEPEPQWEARLIGILSVIWPAVFLAAGMVVVYMGLCGGVGGLYGGVKWVVSYFKEGKI